MESLLRLYLYIVYCFILICTSFLQLGRLDKAGCHEILDRFFALGGNFIDTANMYTKGVSETIIGEWLVKYVHKNIKTVSDCTYMYTIIKTSLCYSKYNLMNTIIIDN